MLAVAVDHCVDIYLNLIKSPILTRRPMAIQQGLLRFVSHVAQNASKCPLLCVC